MDSECGKKLSNQLMAFEAGRLAAHRETKPPVPPFEKQVIDTLWSLQLQLDRIEERLRRVEAQTAPAAQSPP